jgi:hypothetical protein
MTDTHYKLTDQDCRTRGDTLWTPGEWRETVGAGTLCGPGWLHAYATPELALLLNPIHGNIKNPRLWLAEGDGKRLDDGQLKLGCTQLRIVEELPMPVITTEQRIGFAVLCAAHGYGDVAWNEWAWGWLLSVDRSADSAARADSAAWDAVSAAARAAAWAARAAVSAAWDAVSAAWDAWDASAADRADSAAARAAAWAARDAVSAAWDAWDASAADSAADSAALAARADRFVDIAECARVALAWEGAV